MRVTLHCGSISQLARRSFQLSNPHILRGGDHVLDPQVIHSDAVSTQEERGLWALGFLYRDNESER